MTRIIRLCFAVVIFIAGFACSTKANNEVFNKWINDIEKNYDVKIAKRFEFIRSETIDYYNEEMPVWADLNTSDKNRYSPDRKYIYQIHGSIFSMDSGASIFDLQNNMYLLSVGGGDFTEFDYADWINKNQIIVMGTEYDFDVELWMPWYCVINLDKSNYNEDIYLSKIGFAR